MQDSCATLSKQRHSNKEMEGEYEVSRMALLTNATFRPDFAVLASSLAASSNSVLGGNFVRWFPKRSNTRYGAHAELCRPTWTTMTTEHSD